MVSWRLLCNKKTRAKIRNLDSVSFVDDNLCDFGQKFGFWIFFALFCSLSDNSYFYLLKK